MFTCKRCGYTTKTKGNLLKHLKNVNNCEAKKEDVSNDIQIQELTYKHFNEKNI